MTPKEQVLTLYPGAEIEWQYTPNTFYCIMYGFRCLGTGDSEEKAWQSALNKTSNMTHPLLIPRYMVEAECPFLTWGEGSILIPEEDGEMYSKEHGYSPSNQKLFLHEMSRYPKIFRPMQWWEGRKIEEMPKWVEARFLSKPHIHPVEYTSIKGQICIRVVGDILWLDIETACEDWRLAPATEEQYVEYLKSKEK